MKSNGFVNCWSFKKPNEYSEYSIYAWTLTTVPWLIYLKLMIHPSVLLSKSRSLFIREILSLRDQVFCYDAGTKIKFHTKVSKKQDLLIARSRELVVSPLVRWSWIRNYLKDKCFTYPFLNDKCFEIIKATDFDNFLFLTERIRVT